MQALGLTAAEMAHYTKALATTGPLSVELRILDLGGNHVSSLKPQVNSGQIDYDADRDVTRSARVIFNDPNRSLQFDPDSPNDSALYFNRQIQVRIGRFVPELGRKVWATPFTGPVVKFDRTGDEVSLEAQGRESLALFGCMPFTLPRGHNAVDAIHDILFFRAGERRFAFPSLSSRLPKPVTVGWADEIRPWIIAKRIANSLGLHLFYDGEGICRLRDEPSKAQFTFRSGERGNVTSIVQVSHDQDKIKNRVKVIGSKPAHTYTAVLTNSPFSPQSLAVNGTLGFRSAPDIQDNRIKSKTDARLRANREIARYASLSFGATFNSVPVPHLDDLDMIHVDTDEYVGTERLRQFSLPIGGGEMSVGYNDRVSLPRRNVRRP